MQDVQEKTSAAVDSLSKGKFSEVQQDSKQQKNGQTDEFAAAEAWLNEELQNMQQSDSHKKFVDENDPLYKNSASQTNATNVKGKGKKISNEFEEIGKKSFHYDGSSEPITAKDIKVCESQVYHTKVVAFKMVFNKILLW